MCQWLCVSIYLYPAQIEEQENKKTTKIFINHLHVSFVIKAG
ncbi:putative exodeoxyribonuclease VIII [Escherichia phage vB_EcoD_Fulano1]|uniref:Exodeoxyribonuclease VIII n=1 Tax=Escherichia phage vB_EcoD_Fulano1 TaxID=2902670 RepID=A0AC61TR79_9CAUD|nr:putative exodeoxyribonuclease VIII [Escherichia phage vB_EcoD_Fulano1]